MLIFYCIFQYFANEVRLFVRLDLAKKSFEYLDFVIYFPFCVAYAWYLSFLDPFSVGSCYPAFVANFFLRDEIVLGNDDTSLHSMDVENADTILNSKSSGGREVYQVIQASMKGEMKGHMRLAGGIFGIIQNEGLPEVADHRTELNKGDWQTFFG